MDQAKNDKSTSQWEIVISLPIIKREYSWLKWYKYQDWLVEYCL